jgi:hypothetical protein
MWLAEVCLWPEGLSIPSLVPLVRPAGAVTAGQSSALAVAAVRCVAVTPPAPVRAARRPLKRFSIRRRHSLGFGGAVLQVTR